MSSRPVFQTCAQVAPSGECLRGYKPRAADYSHLAPRVAASCLAKNLVVIPGLWTGINCRAVLCCSLCVCTVFIEVLIYSAAKAACSIYLLYY